MANNWIQNTITKFKNFFYVDTGKAPTGWNGKANYTTDNIKRVGGSEDQDRNLANYIAPIPDTRQSQDLSTWRSSIFEMEDPLLPYRYLSQNAFKDTVLDVHIAACINRRKEFTLLRDFTIEDIKGNVNDEWTSYFKKPWFKRFVNYVLDAEYYGYSLIAMGDIVNNEFRDINVIRRTHISPDRLNVSTIAYVYSGENFTEYPYNESHIWIDTPNEHGLSSCGYGLLYALTPLYIILKNNTAWNCAFNEIFGMPLRHLKTGKTSDPEHMAKMSNVMDQMAAKPWIITNLEDELEMLEGGKGSGYKTFGDLRTDCYKLVSKLVLGHGDAMDSAGKTPQQNSSTGMASSPQAMALDAKQAYDGEMVTEAVNCKLFPLMRANGIMIPEDLYFCFSNDIEKDEEQSKKNDENLKISTMVMNMAKGGKKVDIGSLEELTGLKFTEATPVTDSPATTSAPKPSNLANAMNYGKKPAGISEEEWEAYKTDMDYKKATKGFEGDRKKMTKEEYQEYAEEIKQHIADGKPLDRDNETCDVHINCRCYTEDGVWHADPDCCDDCAELMDDYNNAPDDEVKNSIFNLHKVK